MGGGLIIEHLCWESCASECDGDGGNDLARRKKLQPRRPSRVFPIFFFFSVLPNGASHPPQLERVTEGVRGCHRRPIEKGCGGGED